MLGEERKSKHVLSLLENLNLIVKKQQTLAVSTAEHVQPKNVMWETRSSNIFAIESCLIYVTLVHMHTHPFLLSFKQVLSTYRESHKQGNWFCYCWFWYCFLSKQNIGQDVAWWTIIPLTFEKINITSTIQNLHVFSWKGANSVATLTKRWHGAEHVFMAVLYTCLNTNTSSYFCFWGLAVDQQCFCNFTGLGKWVCLAVLITAWWEHLDSLLCPG